ncbi:MAG: putative nucleic-acid-binding protein implicated in transcription termination [Chthonomonadaceae bacterium]|nr:putative nucleic-acid-binding protein implicated in transcription termination [Chthonomonadaceae bacterium]
MFRAKATRFAFVVRDFALSRRFLASDGVRSSRSGCARHLSSSSFHPLFPEFYGTQPMGKRKHIPIRTCVACRETDEKRDLMRVVRLGDGSVSYDPKGKISGRGAYVCARTECVALAQKRKQLERSLKVSGIPAAFYEELGAYATTRANAAALTRDLPSVSTVAAAYPAAMNVTIPPGHARDRRPGVQRCHPIC